MEKEKKEFMKHFLGFLYHLFITIGLISALVHLIMKFF